MTKSKTPTLPKVISVGGRPPGTCKRSNVVTTLSTTSCFQCTRPKRHSGPHSWAMARQRNARNRAVSGLQAFLWRPGRTERAIARIIDDIIEAATPEPPHKEKL